MAVQVSSRVSLLDSLRDRLRQRANTRPADYVLAIVVGALVLIGVLMIYSVSVGPNLQGGSDDPFSLVQRHLAILVFGVTLMLILARLDYRILMRLAVPLMVVTVALLIALLMIGEEVNGARRWLFGPSIQPGEVAKLVTVVYIAAWAASKGKKLKRLVYGLIPFSILIGLISGLIILQPNYSTALLIAGVAFTMFFMAGADLKQFLGATIFGGAAAVVVVTQSARAMSRINTLYVDPLQELTDGSWQMAQSLIALASGGVFGKGLGTGGGQYGYVPLAHSDGIFAIWGEETGLIGAVVLVGLFLALTYRGFRIARNAPDDFGRVLAAGVTFWLVFQAMLNMAVITQLVPFTGQPLPFISYGGSSLVMCLAGVGLLLSISRAMPKPAVVKSVPTIVGAPPKENQLATKKNATISYGGGDRRTRVSPRRRTATTRRRSKTGPGE
ncbi:MAG: cell division protein FtsW [Anaerolineae bacterium]|nr:cell division protein FtsW [Anaerolineae bacterium]